MCLKVGLPQIELALVYLDIGTQQETVIRALHQAEDLADHFTQTCEHFVTWATQELAHRHARDEARVCVIERHSVMLFRSVKVPLPAVHVCITWSIWRTRFSASFRLTSNTVKNAPIVRRRSSSKDSHGMAVSSH